MITIQEFCDQHRACENGREWAIATGCTDMSELWRREDLKPEWREWIATREGVLSDAELHLFARRCVRQVWHLLPDDYSRKVVEMAERFARGEATSNELDTVWNAAYAYVSAYAYSAHAAIYTSVCSARASRGAEWAARAERDAARAASRASALAERDAAEAARDIAQAQAQYLMGLGNPFSGTPLGTPTRTMEKQT